MIYSIKEAFFKSINSEEATIPRFIGMISGVILFTVILLIPAPKDMPVEAWRVAAVVGLMSIWWMSEAIPIAATALLPLILFPILGVAPIDQVAPPYSDKLVYMMLGGFMIGLAMQRSNLHRRIALAVLSIAGRKPAGLVGGFMLATAILSMWISNTATAAMMLPIGVSVVSLLEQDENLQQRGIHSKNLVIALMLGIAMGAGIGGIGTLIGTPPNAVLAGNIDIGFAQWMMLGMPTAFILLFLAWITLTKLVFPVGKEDLIGVRRLIASEKEILGKMRPAEKRVAAIFLFAALSWTFRPIFDDFFPDANLTDAGIAMIAAVALFLIPEDKVYNNSLLDWNCTRDLPWNVMLLIGGGLALGAMVKDSGLADWVGNSLQNLEGMHVMGLAATGALLAMLVSHVTSNTATASTLVPLTISVAVNIDVSPLMLAIPVVMGCSCAFMMPVATPPNAIIYGSGYLTVGQMAKAGFVIGLISLVVIVIANFTLGSMIFS